MRSGRVMDAGTLTKVGDWCWRVEPTGGAVLGHRIPGEGCDGNRIAAT